MWKDTHQRFNLGMLLVVILIVTINTSFLVEIKVTIRPHAKNSYKLKASMHSREKSARGTMYEHVNHIYL
jgi:hypothetical protein